MNDIEEKATPYTFLIPGFTLETKTLKANSGAKAYSQPTTSSTVVYTFPAGIGSYSIDRLLFSESDYWIRMRNLGSSKVYGYVKCSAVNYDYKEYVIPSAQKPNSSLGTNPKPTSNMFYYPNGEYEGVNYPTPLYYQLYHVPGQSEPENSLQCTLLSQISGYYAYNKIAQNSESYLLSMTSKYWDEEKGMTIWLANMSYAAIEYTAIEGTILTKAISNLDNQKPFIVGAQNSEGTPHMVLVTGYKNQGTAKSDFIVLDSSQTKFSNLEAFYKSFPNQVAKDKWGLGGKGYVYGEY